MPGPRMRTHPSCFWNPCGNSTSVLDSKDSQDKENERDGDHSSKTENREGSAEHTEQKPDPKHGLANSRPTAEPKGSAPDWE